MPLYWFVPLRYALWSGCDLISASSVPLVNTTPLEILMKPQLQNKKSNAQTKRVENLRASSLAAARTQTCCARVSERVLRGGTRGCEWGERGAGVRVFSIRIIYTHTSDAGCWIASKTTLSVHALHALGLASEARTANCSRRITV